MRRIEMQGQKYGRLTVLNEDGKYVTCRCECGEEKEFFRTNVLAGYSLSCGCLRNERTQRANTTHGRSRTSLYAVWKGMLGRCYNKNRRQWPWYGGKGIEVCERWHSFENFYADMHERYSPGLTLDRRDSSDDYHPENCRWLTKSQNSSGGP